MAKTLLGLGSFWAHIFCKIDFSAHWKETQNGKEKCKGSLCSSCQFPWSWKSILPGLIQANCQIGLLSPHFPTYLASWMVSRPGSKRATEGLKWAFAWVDSVGPWGYLASCIHGNRLLPAINPHLCHQAHWTGGSVRGSSGLLMAWLLLTGHQSHTEAHSQTPASWGQGGVEGNFFLNALAIISFLNLVLNACQLFWRQNWGDGSYSEDVRSASCWLSGKESACQCQRCRFDPWVGKIPLEEEMVTHSSILAWETPWTEEAGEL